MEKTLIDYLKTVEDHRALRGRRYSLWLMLLLVILGTLSDCQGYSALEDFCVRDPIPLAVFNALSLIEEDRFNRLNHILLQQIINE